MSPPLVTSKTSGICSWPRKERPRERLLAHGPAALTDAELLALFFRNGTAGKDAVALARELLQKAGGLRALLGWDMPRFAAVRGIGAAKAASLLAVTEVARRYLREQIIGKSILSDPEAVLNYLYASLRDRENEVFKVLFLNKAHQILEEKDLFEGTLDAAAVYPREIVKSALDLRAAAVILVHNHPSGRAEPSREDRDITEKIEAACRSVSIEVLDHLIVGDNTYFSFHERELLQMQRKT